MPFGMFMPRPLVMPGGNGMPLPFSVARPKPLPAMEGGGHQPGLPFSMQRILTGQLAGHLAGQAHHQTKTVEERFEKEMDEGE